MNIELPPKKRWALFLDRDGVINRRLPGDYIKHPDQFIFIDGVKPALKRLSGIFPTIIIVTNQQGIGKGLMTEDDLVIIHRSMLKEIKDSGGRIDAVFHCPALDSENHPDRKPAPGMAWKAKEFFPALQFDKCIMAGDSESDMLFGKNLGMTTVFIAGQTGTAEDFGADHCFPDLLSFSAWMEVHQNSVLL